MFKPLFQPAVKPIVCHGVSLGRACSLFVIGVVAIYPTVWGSFGANNNGVGNSNTTALIEEKSRPLGGNRVETKLPIEYREALEDNTPARTELAQSGDKATSNSNNPNNLHNNPNHTLDNDNLQLSNEQRWLVQRLDRLEQQVKFLNEQDLSLAIENLQQKIRQLNGVVEQQSYQLEQLQQALRLVQPLSPSPAPVPSASTAAGTALPILSQSNLGVVASSGGNSKNDNISMDMHNSKNNSDNNKRVIPHKQMDQLLEVWPIDNQR